MRSIQSRPRRWRTMLGLVTSAAMATGVVTVAAPPAQAVTCIRHVYVTLLVYSSLPTPTSNGCWSYERPVQGNWYILRTDGHETNPGSTNGKWVYDDTNPDHVLSTDTNRILQAA